MADIFGADGNDNLYGTTGADSIAGGAGNDTLSGSDSMSSGSDVGDTIDGGAGDDLLSDYSAGNTLLGGAGDDYLVSGGSSLLDGGEGNDEIAAQGTGNTVQGGAGNDVIYLLPAQGIPGDDPSNQVVFNFSSGSTQPVTTTETFDGWLKDHGLTLATLSQGSFASQYTAWLQDLVNRYYDPSNPENSLGVDLDGDGHITIGINQNDPTGLPTIEGIDEDLFFDDAGHLTFTQGKSTQTRYYSNEFSITQTSTGGEGLSSTDGQDVVVGFRSGIDQLVLNGVTAEQFYEYFTVTEHIDGKGNVMGYTISLDADPDDPGAVPWSVMLDGLTTFNPAEDIEFQPIAPPTE